MKFTITSSRLVDAMQTDMQTLRLDQSGVQARKDARRAHRAPRATVASDADSAVQPDTDPDATTLPFNTHPVKTNNENKLAVSRGRSYRGLRVC